MPVSMSDVLLAGNDGDTVIALEQLRSRAFIEHDYATLASLLSDDLVYTHAAGVVHDKAGFLEYAAGPMQCLSIVWHDQQVQCHGNLAVLSGYMVNTLQPPAPMVPVIVETHVLQVWKRERAVWTMLAFQATRLPSAGQ